MFRYICFIILGILFFIFLNNWLSNKENFSIGADIIWVKWTNPEDPNETILYMASELVTVNTIDNVPAPEVDGIVSDEAQELANIQHYIWENPEYQIWTPPEISDISDELSRLISRAINLGITQQRINIELSQVSQDKKKDLLIHLIQEAALPITIEELWLQERANMDTQCPTVFQTIANEFKFIPKNMMNFLCLLQQNIEILFINLSPEDQFKLLKYIFNTLIELTLIEDDIIITGAHINDYLRAILPDECAAEIFSCVWNFDSLKIILNPEIPFSLLNILHKLYISLTEEELFRGFGGFPVIGEYDANDDSIYLGRVGDREEGQLWQIYTIGPNNLISLIKIIIFISKSIQTGFNYIDYTNINIFIMYVHYLINGVFPYEGWVPIDIPRLSENYIRNLLWTWNNVGSFKRYILEKMFGHIQTNNPDVWDTLIAQSYLPSIKYQRIFRVINTMHYIPNELQAYLINQFIEFKTYY